MDREAWQATAQGVTKVRHNLATNQPLGLGERHKLIDLGDHH